MILPKEIGTARIGNSSRKSELIWRARIERFCGLILGAFWGV